MAELDDLVKEFLVESNENLDRLDQDFVALEQDPGATDQLASIFRTIHTIKGTCGFLGFSKLESVTHIGENLLSRLRDGEIGVTSEIITALLRMVDAVREILGSIESGQGEGDGDYSAIIETLTALKDGGGGEIGEASAVASDGAMESDAAFEDAVVEGAWGEGGEAEAGEGEAVEMDAGDGSEIDLSSLPFDGELSAEDGEGIVEEEAGEFVAAEDGAEAGDEEGALVNESDESGEAEVGVGVIDAGVGDVSEPASAYVPEAGVAASTLAAAPASSGASNGSAPSGSANGSANGAAPGAGIGSAVGSGGSETGGTPAASSSPASGGIRVDVGLLDKLMNLVGELVLARNQILQFSATAENAMLSGSTQRLNLITTELQEGVMKTRMQPIGNVWGKFPRIVRDLSQMCGKKVRVEMEGRDTELDKTIIEAIKDPLTHIIRNSVDHGIETPAKRVAAGKPEEGLLYLRAFHEGGQVNIEIVDDGAGINPERVKQRAVERGMISADQAARMGEREAANLIFAAGFSTAEKVTNVSGRGVGMDVVKTNIEKIGGTVDLQSRFGQGTTLRIKIPLTLAIIPALVVTSGGERFAIPQVSLLELVRLGEDQRSSIESIHGTPVYRLRGNLLPLVYLNRELKTGQGAAGQGGSGSGDAGAEGGAVNIIVLQADERQFGLVVDEINDTEEIVVKPLGKIFKGLATFAGATIMGDGRVALILDVMGLAQRAGVVREGRERGRHESGQRGESGGGSRQTLLLFRVSATHRMAIPLSMVARLEEFPRDLVEQSGDQPVMQYRGGIMPLVPLGRMLGYTGGTADAGAAPGAEGAGESIQVIVVARGEQSIGLVVDRIVDIVEQAVSVKRTGVRSGVIGSAVIEGRVTELLDVDGVMRSVLHDGDGSWSDQAGAFGAGVGVGVARGV